MARWWNKLQLGPGLYKAITAGGPRLWLAPKLLRPQAAAEGTTVTPYELFEAQRDSDYLVGKRLGGDGEGTGNSVKIAKPWFLRGALTWPGVVTRHSIWYSSYSASHQSRTAKSTITGETERQRILPWYDAGDIVVAIAMPVTLTETTVAWLDLNVDGRMWATS
jgi:hypothetical protein